MKKIKSLLVILLLIPFGCYAKSSVWIAEKNGHKIFIAGSIHLIHPSQLPLPSEYLKAFEHSKRIVFEVDLAELNSIAVGAKMASIFQLQGTTLDKTLRPAIWQKLQKAMEKYNIPTTVTRFDAAFISFSLPVIIAKQLGYQEGIDRILFDKAKQANKEIVGLETVDQQLAALATLKQLDANLLIEQTLKELDNPGYAFELMAQQVYAGDISLFQAQIVQLRSQGLELFYQNLLVKRNKAWITRIEQYANDGVSTMVVVGELHLVGDDSVLKLLEADGYHISYY